jgi:exopolyphosphatase / guanosine-5'-triphosphate,3'-diphosphate pyrophosphatase
MAKKKSTKKLKPRPKVFVAAIDIGSNAIRMVIAEHSSMGLRLIKKYRFPIRLGADVFATKKISAKNIKLSARTFEKFSQVAQKFKVSQMRAVGTSALRESTNRKAFVELIRRKSGIRIEIIDGVEEARLIYQAVKREINLDAHRSLLIDIGGGSLELTISDHGMMTATHSFPIGTVRTLELLKRKNLTERNLGVLMGEYLGQLSHFIETHSPGETLDFAAGTGGNIEALGRLKPILLQNSTRTFVSYTELQRMIDKLSKMSVKERIEKLGLRPDRADVIVPAAVVVQTVMRQAGIDKLLIPYVGLKDGLLWSLVNQKNYFSET